MQSKEIQRKLNYKKLMYIPVISERRMRCEALIRASPDAEFSREKSSSTSWE